ncbi:MAG: RIP metalloprotease RseP [Candidatus Moranbacteria bacterium]|jgi:regulator of sigma E protease|nr:RIP metalloprotease RseP [Candidatus Moranbacteria bacterium]
MNILIFIIILGVLIFVHELGHFVVAVRNGIKADEFGFGFPPRIFGFVRDEKTGKFKFVFGNKKIESANTIYSINWIPLGGFVKIKGENGEGEDEKDSFAGKSAWIRIKVLSAGVLMNFLLAWFLFFVIFAIGAPESISDDANVVSAKVQVSQVLENTPAMEMGLKVGDEISRLCVVGGSGCISIKKVVQVQDFVSANKGGEILMEIKRGTETLKLQGTPRLEYPADQGSLGISLARTAMVKYPWYQSITKGFMAVVDFVMMILGALFALVKMIFVKSSAPLDISGPVGIAIITKQVAALGLVYVLQFVAILSINLGIINALPFPALDGGRIFFILIEKIKGSPVSKHFEQLAHTAGFLLLIILMIVVTFRDIANLGFFEKIMNFF